MESIFSQVVNGMLLQFFHRNLTPVNYIIPRSKDWTMIRPKFSCMFPTKFWPIFDDHKFWHISDQPLTIFSDQILTTWLSSQNSNQNSTKLVFVVKWSEFCRHFSDHRVWSKRNSWSEFWYFLVVFVLNHILQYIKFLKWNKGLTNTFQCLNHFAINPEYIWLNS